MHHRSFHYRDSDNILNNNITVMLLLRIISQTIVTIRNYPPFTYFHKPNNEPTGSKHVTVLHKNLFYNKNRCVRTRADPQETTRGARGLRRTRVEYHCLTQSAGTLAVRTTNLPIDPLLQARY